LHVSVGSFSPDLIFPGLNIVNDGDFNKGELEIVAFSVPVGVKTTPKFIELDGVMANVNLMLN
jgi:hypothetical protein